jgi:cytochrome P450
MDGGARECLGKPIVRAILREAAAQMLRRMAWELQEGQDLSFKWLPVARPRSGLMLRVRAIAQPEHEPA